MNWKKILCELSEMRVTQKEIAAACGVSQAAVSDLKVGDVAEPRHAFGAALIDLHAKHRLRARRKARKQSAAAQA